MKVRHVVIDIAGKDADIAARIAVLVDARHVDVLFGFVGDESIAAAVAFEPIRKGEVALVAPLAGREAPIDALGIRFVRPSYEAEVHRIVEHFQGLQISRLALVTNDDDQGRWVGDAMERELGKRGLNLAGRQRIAHLDSATPAEVDSVHRSNAQAIVIAADTVPVAEFIKRYRQVDAYTMIVTLSNANHRTLFELLGPTLAHGLMVTQVVPNPFVAESPLLKEYLDAMHKFRDEPPSHLSLEGFVAAKALLEIVRRAGAAPTREGIAKAALQASRIDLNGMAVDLTREARKSSPYVDLTMIRRDGSLLQ
jgi:ABC-type branched-subunit amino acid transport system substrate-binding protein